MGVMRNLDVPQLSWNDIMRNLIIVIAVLLLVLMAIPSLKAGAPRPREIVEEMLRHAEESR